MTNKLQSILYIEDEKETQNELSEIIQDFCETLYLASNGKEGLSLFKKHKPQLIITDIKMPYINGIEMSKIIKTLSSEVFIIFTTAFGDIEFFQEAIDLQVDGYILKPVNLDLLEKKITKIANEIETKIESEKKEKLLIQQSKLATMGEMIGNIAHQWRQPLNTLSGVLMNIIDAKNHGELDEAYLNTQISYAEKYIQYMSQTIDDFRNFYKPITNKEIFSLNNLINESYIFTKNNLELNNIKYTLIDDKEIFIFGYKSQLQQVLINIINNTIEAYKKSNINEKMLIISLEETKYNVIIKLNDYAGGIETKYLEKIFEPYFTTKEKHNGTGLGLYMSKLIIETYYEGILKIANTKKGIEVTISIGKIDENK